MSCRRVGIAPAVAVVCAAVLASAAPAQASSCTFLSGSVVATMPSGTDVVALHRVGNAIYNGGQSCGGATVYNTDLILVHDTTVNRDGDNLVGIDLSGGPFAPGGTSEGPSGVSEIEILLFLYHGTNRVWVTGSDGPDDIHAGVTFGGSSNVRGINLNAGVERGKVSDADVTYQEASPSNAAANEPITFDGGEGDDTFDASGGAGFDGTGFQPVNLLGSNGNDRLVGGGGNDMLYADPGNDVIDGHQGLDSVTYQTSPGPATIDLSKGSPQDTGALGTDELARVELLIGSAHDDALTGSDIGNLIQGGGGNDVLTGRGGNDTLDGGSGSDTASYRSVPAGATQGATVNLGIAGPQNTGVAGSDALTSIENLAGSPFADDLTGDAQSNTLIGWEGEDSLRGEAGDDRLVVRDGTRDLVTCGLGVDSVDADERALDSIFGDCETTAFAPFVPPAGSPTGSDAANPTAPARASFAGSKSSIRVDSKGRFRFGFHAGPALTGRAVFQSVKKVRLSRRSGTTKRITLARRSFTVPASGQVTLRIKLSKRGLRTLKLNRKIGTRVTVRLENAAGLTSTATKKIVLNAPKRRAG